MNKLKALSGVLGAAALLLAVGLLMGDGAGGLADRVYARTVATGKTSPCFTSTT